MRPASVLDKPNVIKKYDKSGMLSLIESFPRQCREAARIAAGFNLLASYRRGYKNIVCAGMGGSAIVADIARSYTLDEAKTPILVNRNYSLPEFVNDSSLVMVLSYSGDTEEALSAYDEARTKLAQILVVTSGGKLKELARRDNCSVLEIPAGLPPRCALGYSFFPVLTALSRLGVIADKSDDIDETIEILQYLNDKSIGISIPGKKNIAKTIAIRMYRKYPVIYASADHIDSVAVRWRGQFAENAKTLSSSHIFPEATHNEIVGWDNPASALRNFSVIMLKDKQDNIRTAKRMDITKSIIKKEGVGVLEINSLGKSLLARIFSLIYIGDFASFYLAILNKEDPTPVERIYYLKERLAKG